MSHPKISQKEDKDQVLDLQETMDKTILKVSTLKSSTYFNVQLLREEHDEELNAAENNGATKFVKSKQS